MERRVAIRNIMVVTAGAFLVPSCGSEEQPTIALKNIALSGAELSMLKALTESLIPHTNDFPGANDLKLHEFVLTMIDDCAKPEDQQSFVKGMKQFDSSCKGVINESFAKANAIDRARFLKLMENDKDSNDDLQKFYRATRRYTIQGFTSSQQFLTQVRKFSLVPGSNFKGCVPVQKKNA